MGKDWVILHVREGKAGVGGRSTRVGQEVKQVKSFTGKVNKSQGIYKVLSQNNQKEKKMEKRALLVKIGKSRSAFIHTPSEVPIRYQREHDK